MAILSAPRILVVDDEPTMREMLRIVLRRDGYDVDVAENGEEAIALLRHEPFDALVLDIRMPDVSGIDVLRAAKQIDGNIVVFMMTAFASTESAVEAMRLGAADYFTKPFNMDDLRTKVRQHLETRRAEEFRQSAASETIFVCQECGWQSPKWVGRCAECGVWNPFVENDHAEDAGEPLPPGFQKDETGRLFPAPGWEWVAPEDPEDLNVRLREGYSLDDDGHSIRPAAGWEWADPHDPGNFEVRQVPTEPEVMDPTPPPDPTPSVSHAEATLANAYAVEDANLAAWGGKEMLRLQLLMDYSEAFAADSPEVRPVAGVRWAVLSDKFQNETSVREFKIILAAFLYAKALACDQHPAQLFQLVGNALRKCLASGDMSAAKPFSASELIFAPMFVTEGPFTNIVWPWKIASWSDVEERLPGAFVQEGATTIATSTLLSATLLMGPVEPNAPGGLWLRLRGVDRLTKIFVPASALIAISHVWDHVPEGRGMTWSLLKHINDYHETPDHITVSEVFAMNAAIEVLASGGKRNVGEFRRRDGGVVDWTPLEKGLANALGSVFSWFRRK